MASLISKKCANTPAPMTGGQCRAPKGMSTLSYAGQGGEGGCGAWDPEVSLRALPLLLCTIAVDPKVMEMPWPSDEGWGMYVCFPSTT